MENDFTVTLDQRRGHNVRGTEVGGATLRGKPVYVSGVTGLAESIQQILDAGLIHTPTYSLIHGRQFVGKDNEAWRKFHDSRAEVATVLDKKGIMGKKDDMYALHIENGGFFVWNPQRIKQAVNSNQLVNYALKLEQTEVDAVLDAIKRQDTVALEGLVHGGNVAFAGDYNGFLEASAAPGFIDGMNTTFAVIRPVSEASQVYSGRQAIAQQRSNPNLVIASGGTNCLGKMLNKAESFGWSEWGSWHDGYKNTNTARSVTLYNGNHRLSIFKFMYDFGRPVGVDPKKVAEFYKKS